MRKLYSTLLLLVVGLLAACSPAWWQSMKENPVQTTETMLGTVDTIQKVATITFDQLKIFLPADKQEIFQQKFDEANLTLLKAVQAVRSAVQAAANAQEKNPDLTKVVSDVVKALQDIQAVVMQVKDMVSMTVSAAQGSGGTVKAPTPATTQAADDLKEMVEAFKQQAAVK
jgi:hypothetical protein